MEASLFKLAKAIKKRRQERNLNLEELAALAGVSKSLISKIENFRTIPSLPVIIRLAQALHTNLSELSAGIESNVDAEEYIVVRRDEREREEREEATGFIYHTLAMRNIGGILFESSILTLERDARRKPVTSDGHEFLYILKGSIEFFFGDHKIELHQGDAFLFDGRLPHVPKNIGRGEAEFLVVYLIDKSSEEG